MIECNHDFTFCNIIVKKPSLFGLKKMIIERINLQNCPTNMTAFAFRIKFEGDMKQIRKFDWSDPEVASYAIGCIFKMV